MAYTNVFGGNTIYPSDVSYLALALSADSPLEWPLESSGTEAPAARIIDVTPTAAGFSVIMPDATQTGAGQTILFNNLSGTYSFFVKDFAGNTLATVGFGAQWQVYLADTATAAGTWRVFRYGASTATVQPSALAGFGLTVTSSTLSQAAPVTSFSTTGLTLASSSRAGAFVWTGTGAGTLNLPAAATVGNNYFVLVRNAGGGNLTVDPAGTEVINGAATLAFQPGDSATLITDGSTWYSVGFGQNAVFAFDYTSISVTGGNYTLAGSELNRIAYKFVGTLTSDLYVIIPATVQQYWITNATTGSFNFYVKIAGGTPTQVQQNAKGIYYCDGTNVILASDPTSLSTPVAIAQGGTGATSASAARLSLGISTFADAIVTATTGASVRATIGAAASGANTDITSLTGLTTALSVAQGGTGAATASAARTSLGATTLGGNLFTLTNPSAVTFPRFNADNSVSALDAATFLAAIGGGTVSSVAALTLGTSGSDLSSTVASGTTTPVITLNVPTASATNRGALSAADWSTFNSKAASGANTDITALNQSVTVAASGVIAANTIGYRGVPQNAQSTSYTFAGADQGKHVYSTNTGAQAITVPTNAVTAFPVGTAITVVNNGTTAITFTTTGTTVYKAGTSAAWASGGTLAVRGMATWLKVATDTWFVSGAGLS